MKKESKKTYETIIKDLGLIISKLNSTDIAIENSILLYEEGIKLSNEADKELSAIEKNIDGQKKIKKNTSLKINIEKSFKDIENIIKNLEDENITITKAEYYYKEALEIILNIESYLKNAKTTIKKYEK